MDRDVVLTKKMWEHIENSHFETASNSF